VRGKIKNTQNQLTANDVEALEIIEIIRKHRARLALSVGELGNIYTVFFHDLVVHFTGIVIQRRVSGEYVDGILFPWVDKSYSLDPFYLDIQLDRIKSLTQDPKTWLRRQAFCSVALGEALPISGYGRLFASQFVNLLGGYKEFVRGYLQYQEQQIEDLAAMACEICTVFAIRRPEIIVDNWRRYALLHTTGVQEVVCENGIILGTRNNLQNRKLAVNYLQQGKEVVAITHGEVANSVMDEPPFGYSERTLCKTLIDYGDFDKSGRFNAPLVAPEKRLYRTSVAVSDLHRPSDRIVLPSRERVSALYIPTTYSGNGLYGPFHCYEDCVYRDWHFDLFASFSGLTFKVHPKSRADPPRGVRFDNRRLEVCINDYNLLVFDYFATGAMLALASEKPVIYFDIGLRQLHPYFLSQLKKRCEYARIDLSGHRTYQVKEILASIWSKSIPRSNLDIVRFSVSRESKFDLVELFSAVNKGVSPNW
jgi:hypothetical protein